MQNNNNFDAIDQMPTTSHIANTTTPAEESKHPAALSSLNDPAASSTLVESVAEPTDGSQDQACDVEEKPEPLIDILNGNELTQLQYEERA